MTPNEKISVIADAVAIMLRKGDVFPHAFELAFAGSDFNFDDKEVVMSKVGSILNERRQKKCLAGSTKLSSGQKPALQEKNAEQTELFDFSPRRYPD